MNKKTKIIIGLLLSIVLLQSQVSAQIGWTAKRLLYAQFASGYGTEGWEELRDNIVNIILANPSPDELYNLMGIIMKVVIAFYIPIIAFLGFYLLFLSSSPEGRAKAKGMLSRLIIGLVAVSISPQLIKIILDISEGFTSSILALTETGIFSKALSETIGAGLPLPSGLVGLHLASTIVSIEMGFYIFLFFMILVWGSFLFPIVIRFLAVSTFIVLFPLSIFLYSFEFSRALGRIMLEQTLIWTFLQAINALIILTVALCISSMPPGFMKIELFWIIPDIDVIPMIGCFMFPIAPLFIIRFFRGFLP